MLFAITNSSLCKEDFLTRLDKIASAKPDRIILREKHLSHEELYALAENVSEICLRHCVPLSINSDIEVAQRLSADIHLPYSLFIENHNKLKDFRTIGVSVHSKNEAVTAEKLGSSYLIAGHIFATDCKKGLEPKGLEYLSGIVNSVDIPVLGIGGITTERITSVLNTGAAGICVMSHFMTCGNSELEVRKFKV